MRNYSFIKTIPLSFYSRALYQDVGRNWEGMGFAYLLLLTTLLAVPAMLVVIVMSLQVTLHTPYDFSYLIDQVPPTAITNGQVSSEVAQPYFIREKDTGEVIGILDTTRAVSEWSEQLKTGRFYVIVGKTQILTQGSKRHEQRIYTIAEDTNMLVTRDSVRELGQKLADYAWVLPLLVTPFVIISYFLFRLLQSLLYGLIGMLISKFTGAGLRYHDCVRLAAVALTPLILLGIVTGLIIPIPISGWVIFLLEMMYLYYAIKANA